MKLTSFCYVVALLATGCSAASKDMASLDSGRVADEGEGNSEQDSGESAEPTWWRLDADLEVASGQLNLTGSQLTVSVLDYDGIALCSEDVRVAGSSTIAVRPEPELLGWWSITLGEGTRTCGGTFNVASLPSSIEVGIGVMHPELEAIGGLASDLPSTGVATLNAAYARTDPSANDIWVYGYAGNDSAWLGIDGPADAAPLADGQWALRGVYSFPISGEGETVR